VKDAHASCRIIAEGQHGIGGPNLAERRGDVKIIVEGTVGQRVGSMGMMERRSL